MGIDILFRGKLSHLKQWVEGNLITARNGAKYIIPFDIFERDGHHLVIDSDEPYWVDPETVGQFTGLTDKNDKRIYDGDIVINKNLHSKKWVVEYRTDSEYVGFVLVEVGKSCISYFTSRAEVEIMGNIHDNPELL